MNADRPHARSRVLSLVLVGAALLANLGQTGPATALAQPTPDQPQETTQDPVIGVSTDLSRSIGVIGVGDGPEPMITSAAALIAPDRALASWYAIDGFTNPRFISACCGERPIIRVLDSLDGPGLLLLELGPAATQPEGAPTTAHLALPDALPDRNDSVSVSIGIQEGVGVIAGTLPIASIDTWPGDGELITLMAPMSPFAGGGIVLSQQGELLGMISGGGGADTSLYTLLTPEIVARLRAPQMEPMTLDAFAAREPSALLKGRRLARAAYEVEGHEAIALLEDAIEIAPDLWRERWRLGVLQDEQGLADLALVTFEHAANAAPLFVEAPFSMGIVLMNLVRFDEAITWFDRAIRINPRYASAYAMKGVALFNKGDQGLGIDWARKGFELNPEDGLLAQQVASLLVQAERVDEVPGVWTLYCRTVSDDPGGWAELAGSLAVLEGRLPEACDAMERASMLEPENPNLWLQLALYAQRAEQWERATDAVDRALAIDPEYEFARQLKAQIEAKRPADGADAEGAEEDDK